jgi:hypothetical protein
MEPNPIREFFADKDCSTCRYEETRCPAGCDVYSKWKSKFFLSGDNPTKSTPTVKDNPGGTALKNDSGKPRYDLIPSDALDGLARLLGQGATKYEARNWEKGFTWSRLYAALERHARKWWRGQDYDVADGQHHLLSVIATAMMLYAHQARNLGQDDRDKLPGFDPDFWSSRKARKPTAE